MLYTTKAHARPSFTEINTGIGTNGLRFGMELEKGFNILSTDEIDQSGIFAGVVSDGSIHRVELEPYQQMEILGITVDEVDDDDFALDGRQTGEFLTNIVHIDGAVDFCKKQFSNDKVAKKIVELPTNNSCGGHISFSFDNDFLTKNKCTTQADVYRKFERDIFRFVFAFAHSERSNNHFCCLISNPAEKYSAICVRHNRLECRLASAVHGEDDFILRVKLLEFLNDRLYEKITRKQYIESICDVLNDAPNDFELATPDVYIKLVNMLNMFAGLPAKARQRNTTIFNNNADTINNLL